MSGPRTGPMSRLRVLVLALVGVLLATGCDLHAESLPLPGGPDTGERPISVRVQFRDVLDLVPQSTVKVDDVNVGKVTAVELDGFTAVVDLELRRDVDLPDNTLAEIRQTSLLGEKFVSLSAPADGSASGRLGDGDVIPLERSGRNPEVEEVFGALSLILNGGGVAQLQTITRELNKVLEGREGSARSVLRQVAELTGQLDENKADIVRAIEELDRFARSVKRQLPTIDAALEELPSALRSIDKQRRDLVRMLAALEELSSVGVDVIQASKAGTIDTLRRLDPVLTSFAASGDDFVNAFNVFLTYPFVDEAVGRDPQVARNLHMGDYTNLSIDLQLNLNVLPSTLPTRLPTEACIPLSQIPQDGPLPDLSRLCQDALDAIQGCLDGIARGDLRPCIGLPPSILRYICQQSPVPGLCFPTTGPTPTVLPSILPTSFPTIIPPSIIPTILPSLLPTALPTILPGLPRPGPGQDGRGAGARGATYGQLSDTFDPDLVALLVPPLDRGVDAAATTRAKGAGR